MHDSDIRRLAGMMAAIAYEMHDKEFVDEDLREMLLEFWRLFDVYN